MVASETYSPIPESPEPESYEGSELQDQDPSDPECVEERFRMKLELMLYVECLIDDRNLSWFSVELFQKLYPCVGLLLVCDVCVFSFRTVCLMFDLKDEGESNPRKLAQIMQNLGVFISVKPKVKQTAKSVVVKGLERNISSQYEARCLLLGLDSTEVSMTTKNVSEQLHLTECVCVFVCVCVINKTQNFDNVILETEDQPTQAETEPFVPSHEEVTEVLVKPSVSSRRGSQSEASREPNSPITPERSVRVEVNGVYLNKDRRCSLRIFPSVDTNNGVHFHIFKLKTKLLAVNVFILGFSKSMPTIAIKELRAVSRRCYRPYHNQQLHISTSGKERGWNGSDSENWRERRGSVSSSPPPSSSSSSSGGASRHLIGRSPSPTHTDDLIELLAQLGLEKYIDIFQQQEVHTQPTHTSQTAHPQTPTALLSDSEKRKFPEVSSVKSGYLEGGVSGRLPRIMNEDGAVKSSRW
uniref:Bicaudal C homolog 2 n=1 Tax=Cyprinus carpio TaxID=7962 RepID=A0A8C2AA81_CYPCA